MKNPFTSFFNRRTSVRRDYASGTTRHASNPLFTRPTPRRIPWSLLCIMLVLIGGSAYTVYTPQYRITAVTVHGAIKVDRGSVERFVKDQLDQTLLGVQWRRVTFLTPTKRIESSLRKSIERLISLNGLTVDRVGLHELKVTLNERTPNTVWETATGNRYLIDEGGVVVERLSGEVPAGFELITDVNGIDTTIGSTVMRREYLAVLRVVRDALHVINVTPKQFTTWNVECRTIIRDDATTNDAVNTNTTNSNSSGNDDRTISIVNAGTPTVDPLETAYGDTPCDERKRAIDDPTLVVSTDEDWDIRLDTSKDLQSQVKKLQLAIEQKFKTSRKGLEYVDVRFGDRVYYK